MIVATYGEAAQKAAVHSQNESERAKESGRESERERKRKCLDLVVIYESNGLAALINWSLE